MNKRIKKLLEQATTIEVISGRGFDTTQYIERFDEETFAKLIIKECVEIAKVSERHGALGWYEITKHFGLVE